MHLPIERVWLPDPRAGIVLHHDDGVPALRGRRYHLLCPLQHPTRIMDESLAGEDPVLKIDREHRDRD